MKILWIPHTGWHIPQRAHLFCHALAERHEVHTTDWVADFATPRDYLSRRYLRNFGYRRYREGKVTIHGIPRISPALFVPALRRFNTRIFAGLVDRIIAQHEIDVVVGTFVVPPPVAPRLVFDLFDDNVAYWRSFGRVPAYAEEIAQTERDYLETADAVVAVSSVLVEMAVAKGARGPVHHIPNGVDLRQFERADGARIRHHLGVQGPLIGSLGNHDKLPELERILGAAQAFDAEEYTFLIAGRGAAVPAARELVDRAGMTNVIFEGFIPPAESADWIGALDVGLCPYDRSPGADASSPMRLLVYAAAGLPTVCTRLEEVRRMAFPNVVLADDTPESFAARIRQALRLPRARPPQIEAYDLRRLVAKFETVLEGGSPSPSSDRRGEYHP